MSYPQPCDRKVHVIVDNFAAHKTKRVKGFLKQHPNVNLHFTPTQSSWLNQVESWFSKLQRDVIDRDIFTSVADLKRKILHYIRLCQKTAKPFQWKYSDVRKRILAWQRQLRDSPLVAGSEFRNLGLTWFDMQEAWIGRLDEYRNAAVRRRYGSLW